MGGGKSSPEPGKGAFVNKHAAFCYWETGSERAIVIRLKETSVSCLTTKLRVAWCLQDKAALQ